MSGREDIDELAYRFWSVHPRELDAWIETAPPMPDGYKGGVRAWFFACHILAARNGALEEAAEVALTCPAEGRSQIATAIRALQAKP